MDSRQQWVVSLSEATDCTQDLIGGKTADLVRARSTGLVVLHGFCVDQKTPIRMPGSGLARFWYAMPFSPSLAAAIVERRGGMVTVDGHLGIVTVGPPEFDIELDVLVD